MKLYSYYRSSAAYRVRIALNIKRVDAEIIPVNLLNTEHQIPEFLKKNPSGLVPAFEDKVEGETAFLSQSMAICEFLEESHPEPPLLPKDAFARAQVRALTNTICCDIHPLNNLRVLRYLENELSVSEDQKKQWYAHWVRMGFKSVEQQLRANGSTGKFCYGDTATLADLALIPQVYNALRFKCDLNEFTTIRKINENCNQISAFIDAHPDNQTG